MVRLARAAHRLQAWSVLIAAATEAMKIIPATERLVLHRELDLESIQAQQIGEIERMHRASNARAVARGLPERAFATPAPPDANWSYETVFFDVVKTTSLALPVAGLDDKLNLQLALARASLLEKRRKRLADYFEKATHHFRLEAYIAVAGLDICSETVDTWHAERVKKGTLRDKHHRRTAPLIATEGFAAGIKLEWVRGYLQTEAQDREEVKRFCGQSKS